MENSLYNDLALTYFVQQIRSLLHSHVKNIILFGSRARKDNRKDSDYDCLIIVDNVTEDIDNIIDEITGETLYRYDRVFSAIAVTEERYEKEIYNPLFMNIYQEGIKI
ncbi:MAG: nucleotidyltransferase domain-containing protein [Candidatus Eremiobacterota bacterium]